MQLVWHILTTLHVVQVFCSRLVVAATFLPTVLAQIPKTVLKGKRCKGTPFTRLGPQPTRLGVLLVRSVADPEGH